MPKASFLYMPIAPMKRPVSLVFSSKPYISEAVQPPCWTR